jgi:hypothetical protein
VKTKNPIEGSNDKLDKEERFTHWKPQRNNYGPQRKTLTSTSAEKRE